jgi:glycosyltransferase involved in cell wall biosynthesis
MRVAYLSPLPPERSGIADYSALLLPELTKRIGVHVVRRGRRPPKDADVVLYHIGNDPTLHGWIYERLHERPGLVVLHDFVVHHLIAGLTLGRGDGGSYLAALEREAGIAGRLMAHGVIDGSLAPLWDIAPERFPLVREILPFAEGLIVHSRYVEALVRARGYERPVWRIPHPAWPVPARPRLELYPGRYPVVGAFGHLNARKRLNTLLDGFAQLRRTHPAALLVLAGSVADGGELRARLREYALTEGSEVVHEGYVSEARLWDLLAAADICVNLRYPTMGETSGIVLRALSLGRATVVNDVGSFSELPSDATVKLQVGPGEARVLAAFLARLSDDADLRERIAESGRAYVRREHSLAMVSDRYVAALEEAAGAPAVRDAVLGDIALAASEIGLTAADGEIHALAQDLRELGLR